MAVSPETVLIHLVEAVGISRECDAALINGNDLHDAHAQREIIVRSADKFTC